MKAVVIKDLMQEVTGNPSRVGLEVDLKVKIENSHTIFMNGIPRQVNKDVFLCEVKQPRTVKSYNLKQEVDAKIAYFAVDGKLYTGNELFSPDEVEIIQ